MKKTIITIAVVGCLLVAHEAFSQPSKPPRTPIDGGLSILLAGGAAYGIKKMMDSKKKA